MVNTYDRTKQAGAYDKHLSNAVSRAKGYWGSGWANLTPDMKQAFVCKFLVANLAGVDFEAAFQDSAKTDLEQKLLSRLKDLEALFGAAISEG